MIIMGKLNATLLVFRMAVYEGPHTLNGNENGGHRGLDRIDVQSIFRVPIYEKSGRCNPSRSGSKGM